MTADIDTLTLDFGVDQRTPDPGEYFANGSWFEVVGAATYDAETDTLEPAPPVKPHHAKPWQVWERFVSHGGLIPPTKR